MTSADFELLQIRDTIFYRSPNYPRYTTNPNVRYKGVIVDAYGEFVKVRCLGQMRDVAFSKDWQGAEEFISREDIIRVATP